MNNDFSKLFFKILELIGLVVFLIAVISVLMKGGI